MAGKVISYPKKELNLTCIHSKVGQDSKLSRVANVDTSSSVFSVSDDDGLKNPKSLI